MGVTNTVSPPPPPPPPTGCRLSYRQEWDVDFRAYLKRLDQTKPLLLCGDLNVAHTEIGNGRSCGSEGVWLGVRGGADGTKGGADRAKGCG